MFKKIVLFAAIVAFYGCQTYRPLNLSLDKDLENWQNNLIGINHSTGNVPNEDKSKLKQSLSLATAREFAVRYNPEFVVSVQKLATAEAVAENSGLWQDPSIGADAGKVLIKDPARDWTSGVNIGLSLPINGALAVEKELANKQKFAEAANLKQQRANLLKSLNTAWYEWSALQKKIGLYQNYTATLSGMLKRAKKLAEVGELESTDVRQLSVRFMESENNISALNIKQQQLYLQILLLIGISPNAKIELSPEPVKPQVELTALRQNLIKNNPKLILRKKELEVADSAYRLEIRRQYPDIELSSGYVQDLEERSIPISISFTLPLWNRNKLGVAKSEKKRDEALSSLKAELAKALFQLKHLELQHQLAREYAQNMDKNVIPLINQQIKEVNSRLQAGEVDILLITDVMERYLEMQEKTINAKLAVSQTTNEIQAMIGFNEIEKEQ